MDVYRGTDKVAEFESYDELRVGDGKPAFIYEGNELVYPSPVKDGLVLWYDFSGRTNDDAQRNVAEDLSGNENHGTLQNFNFTAESGYNENKLLFDGVDDRLDIPQLNLSETGMSVGVDGEVYAYEDDKVITVGENGIEVGGRNLLLDSEAEVYNDSVAGRHMGYSKSPVEIISGEMYTISFDAKTSIGTDEFYASTFIRSGNTHQRIVNNMSPEESYKRYSFTFKATEDSEQINGVFFVNSVNNHPGNTGVLYLKNIQLEKGTIATDWTPAPEDYKTTTFSPSSMRNLQLYNRPLTPSEITHNYAIEKERFGIE